MRREKESRAFRKSVGWAGRKCLEKNRQTMEKGDETGRMVGICRSLTNAIFEQDVGKCLVFIFCSGIL